jgi:hypothetical protein
MKTISIPTPATATRNPNPLVVAPKTAAPMTIAPQTMMFHHAAIRLPGFFLITTPSIYLRKQ